MPLEIRELIIKATVDNNGSGSGASGTTDEHGASGGSGDQTETMVNLCVEKVLEILKEKSER
jgi:Family of unknown function (DUF5908)